MSSRARTIDEVVAAELCSGCGACAYIEPDRIRMVDFPDRGLRPVAVPGESSSVKASTEPLDVCPGLYLEHQFDRSSEGLISSLVDGWGPVYGIWEGHAADPEINLAGSSGGAASALALAALKSHGFAGVLHTAARSDAPHLNEAVFSRSREELLARTGSRYAPASPCDGLGQIEHASGPCVFIGKPCDVAGAKNAARLRPELATNLGLTIAFFCAGTPSTSGTLEMLKTMGVQDPALLKSLRYRGNGWPGHATAVYVEHAGGPELRSTLTYEDSWGSILTHYVQWRCRLCLDHTGEFADISVGDPWYREILPGELGTSLVIARTRKGLEFIASAIEHGWLVANAVAPDLLPASQPNLLKTRGAVWGRLLASRAMLALTPSYSRLPSFRFWWSELDAIEKIRSILGTVRRLVRRGLVGRAGKLRS